MRGLRWEACAPHPAPAAPPSPRKRGEGPQKYNPPVIRAIVHQGFIGTAIEYFAAVAGSGGEGPSPRLRGEGAASAADEGRMRPNSSTASPSWRVAHPERSEGSTEAPRRARDMQRTWRRVSRRLG